MMGAAEKEWPGNEAEQDFAKYLVANHGAHFVTIVRRGVGRLLGVSIPSQTIVVKELMDAASASTLESLQRENEELRLRGDGAANMARQMASDCSNAQKSLAELRSAIDPINELLAHLLSMSAYHISNPPTPDWEFVQVCNGDLRKMIELSDAAEYALASTGGEHHGN